MSNIEETLERISDKNIRVLLDENALNIKVRGDLSALTNEDKQFIKVNKDSIISLLKAKKLRAVQKFKKIDRVELSGDGYPLSYAQNRVWISSQFDAASQANNMPFKMELPGDVDPVHFKNAILAVINRHEILRTVFKENNEGEIRQWIIDPESFSFELKEEDFSNANDPEKAVMDYVHDDELRVFNLEKDPLLRASLIRLPGGRVLFYYNMHHIISDAWSMEVLFKDVLAYYESFSQGIPVKLDPLPIQYKDYASWQLNESDEEANLIHKKYWEEQFSGELPLLSLPEQFSRPKIKTYAGKSLSTFLSAEATGQLRAFCQERGGTVFMGLVTVWNILYNRYTGQREMIVGTPVAGRDHVDLKDQIGFYINTLALRNEIQPSESFDANFDIVKKNTLEAYTHQSYPFDRLVDELELRKDQGRSLLFDVLITHQSAGKEEQAGQLTEDQQERIQDNGFMLPKFDMDISFEEKGGLIYFHIGYNTDIYTADFVSQLMVHFRSLLTHLLEDPAKPVAAVSYLSAEEEHSLLYAYNATETAYPKKSTVVSLFVEQAAKHPEKTALISGDRSLTYRVLDEMSSQLMHDLMTNHGVKQGDHVGLMLPSNEGIIVSMLAILKCGAIYVPIDADFPLQRKEFIFEDTALNVLITTTEQMFTLGAYAGSIYAYDVEFEFKEGVYYESHCSLESAAYIMYTSGSTGQPKGVVIEQQGIVRLVKDTNYYQFSANDRVLATGSFTFDATTFEYWGPLLNGGTLILVEKEILLDNEAFLSELTKHDVTITWLTVGFFNQLADLKIEVFGAMKRVIFGGERVSLFHIDKVKSRYPDIILISAYGPTENTTYTSTYVINEWKKNIPLGQPISNTTAYVLDEFNQLLPYFAAGEICVGGDGLARGYLNNDSLTAEKFIHHPYLEGERIYKTGDIGRRLPDGNLEFIGRKDEQVKIRGFRIELGEIEYVLSQNEWVKESVVLVKTNAASEKELVAFIVPGKELSASELRGYLKELLPEYMLPTHYVFKEKFPLTSNGKIDKKKLLSEELGLVSSGEEYIAPVTELEKAVAEIWSRLLSKEHIGMQADFFTLGGHSLKAIRLIGEYHKSFDVKLSLKDIFSHPLLSEQVALLEASHGDTYSAIEVVAKAESYAISDAQRRLWVMSQFEQGLVAYNMPFRFMLPSDIDVTQFKASIHKVIERHEILRTVFRENAAGEVRQWVLEARKLNFNIEEHDFSDREAASAFLSEEELKPFDLENGPLIRAGIMSLSGNEQLFYYTMHHIISDGWSIEVLLKDVLSYYQAFVEEKNPELPELKIQYKDYASWQLGKLDSSAFKVHRDYWVEQFSDELPVLELPAQHVRPKIRTFEGRRLSTYLSTAQTSNLKEYSQSQGGSLFMGLMAVWNVLCFKYTGQKDIITGSPVAGRDHADLEYQIGFYVNTLALRYKLDPEASFATFFEQVKAHTLNAYQHQMYPFDRLVDELNLERDTSRNALFDVLLTLQNNADNAGLIAHPEGEDIQNNGSMLVKLDMEVTFEEKSGRIYFNLIYNTNIYSADFISQLMMHFRSLLTHLLEDPAKPVAAVSYLSAEEEQFLLYTYNATKTTYPKESTIASLFAQQVTKHPEKTALISGDRSLTYRTLDEMSSQLMHDLMTNHGVKQGDHVGLMLPSNEGIIVSMLAILKCGATYIPIDADFPLQRKEFIFEDTALNVLITTTEQMFTLGAYAGSIYAYDVEFEFKEGVYYDSHCSLESPAYIMYTSGSTGRPKGVVIEQQGIVRLVKDTNYYQFSANDRVLATGSFTFDATTFEYWGPLLNGGTLIIIEKGILLDDEAFLSELTKHDVTITWLTVGFFNLLADTNMEIFAATKTLIVGGDRLSPAHIQKVQLEYPNIKIINGYGPTENTTFSITHQLIPGEKNIPLGQPISNTTAYILDEFNQLLPHFVTGEICLGGDGLARGYLNNDSLTAEKFVAHPYLEGERIYKTGDLGRRLPNGNLEFIGRKDEQVKIRGFRIELGEIEYVLSQNEWVKESVVLVKTNAASEKELVAFIVPGKELSASELRGYLKELLPEYMLPSHYVFKEKFPLTSNGKTDKKALLTEELGPVSSEYTAPVTELEKAVAEIWSRLLGKERVDMQADFFTLGGHSLKAIRLIGEYHKLFEIRLSLKDVFNHPVLSEQVALLEASHGDTYSAIEVVEKAESYAISDAQRRLWVMGQFEQGLVAYNMPFRFILPADIDLVEFKASIHKVIERHEILRTVFRENAAGEVRQWILEAKTLNFNIEEYDLPDREAASVFLSEKELEPFDLENGPLIRAGIVRSPGNEQLFYYTMHHIISDGWSMEVLLKDVLSYYRAYTEGKKPELPELKIQYKDYANWQLGKLDSLAFKVHRDYWVEQFSDELPVLELPTQHVRPKIRTFEGKRLSTYLNASQTLQLKEYSKAHGGSLFMGLMAVWNVLCFKYTGQKDIITGSPVAGRDHSDLEHQIGFYVNTLALRYKVDPEASFATFFEQVKAHTLNAYQHQMYPFDRLVDELSLERDTSRNPLFDVLLNLQNNADNTGLIAHSNADPDNIQDLKDCISRFELELSFEESADQIEIVIIYNTNIYSKEFITAFIRHFKQLMSALLAEPHKLLEEVEYLDETERKALLELAETPVNSVENYSTIIEAFEDQVSLNPERVAIIHDGQVLTYASLSAISNRFAHYLSSQYQVKKGDQVLLKLDRNEDFVVSVLAILKLGGTYVPIDPDYPQERIKFLEEDSDAVFQVTQEVLDDFKSTANSYDSFFEPVEIAPTDLAYIIYTSGSTGKPKGVKITHQNVLSLVFPGNYIDLKPSDVLLATGSVSFDISTFEIYAPLLRGASLAFCTKEELLDLTLLEARIQSTGTTVIHFIPAMLNRIIDESPEVLSGISKLITGGDKVSAAYLNKLRQQHPDLRVYHAYGPTESTTFTTVFEVTEDYQAAVPLGKPFAGRSVYILDANQRLVPENVVGEICIGGAGISPGYYNRDALTAEKFIDHPYLEGERIYKSGDLGRRLPGGNLEFIGRKDEQVKIRGFRIELGEIEYVLSQNEWVKESVVLVKTNAASEKELVAFIVPGKELSASELRGYLKDLLPEYMLPSHYVFKEKFPLTSNGKIDKKKLLSEELGLVSSGEEYITPVTKLEKAVSEIWCRLLGKERVDMQADFFTLGGHSLKAIRLIGEYHKSFGVKLSFKDIFSHPLLSEQVALLEASHRDTYSAIEVVAKAESYAISDAQRRLWVMSQFEQGLVAYNMPFRFMLPADIDVAQFKASIHKVIERHEILRTVFRENAAGEVRQWILEPGTLNFNIEEHDFSDREEASIFLSEEELKSFDLENGPLIRAGIMSLSGNEQLFYYTMHHIISDGWSMEVLLKDVLSYYRAYTEGKKPELPRLKIQYKDYASWQLGKLDSSAFKAHRDYWVEQFSDELPVLELPAQHVRPKMRTFEGRRMSTYLNASQTLQLKEYSQSHGGSLFMGLMAVWNVLCFKYTGQKDIITGSPVAGRDHADLEHQIGFYVNTLALRYKVDPEASFATFFEQVKAHTLNAYQHQMYPFDRLVDELNLERDTSRNAIFDVLLTLQNNAENAGLINTDTENIQDLDNGVSKFELELSFEETSDQIQFVINYNISIYSKEFITALVRHFKQLASALLAEPHKLLEEVEYLDETERKALLELAETPVNSVGNYSTIIEAFEARVSLNPESVAVIYDEQALTYKSLSASSNRFANYLSSQYQVKKGDQVLLKLDRNEDFVVSVLAILKMGGTYVPIDPDYPQERIKFLEEDSDAVFQVTQEVLEDFKSKANSYNSFFEPVDIAPGDLAYIIYTSGSTGKPKGVKITHQNVLSLVFPGDYIDIKPSDVLLATGSVSFDISTFEIYAPLLRGASLAFCTKEELLDLTLLEARIQSTGTTVIHFIPALLNRIIDESPEVLSGISKLITGGDKVSATYLNKLRQQHPDLRVYHAYGPTESTTFTTVFEVTKDYQAAVPLGRPFAGRSVYILDANQRLVPKNVVGEICIGGAGISPGYYNSDALTAEKFIDHFYRAGEKLYRSGDYGKWLPDNTIAFLGRQDEQVKIRGHRVEIAEIEHIVNGLEAVNEAVVLTRKNDLKENELIAYVIFNESDTVNNLADELRNMVPGYMVPHYFVTVDHFPLTENGKIDKQKLLAISVTNKESQTVILPETETEKGLYDVWIEIFGHEKFGIDHSMMELGAHSLTLVLAISKIRKALNIKLKLDQFYLFPTIRGLGKYIDENRSEEDLKDDIISRRKEDVRIISHAQKRMWIIQNISPKDTVYNVSLSYVFSEKINVRNLAKAFAQLVNEHEILRSKLISVNGEPLMETLTMEQAGTILDYEDIRNRNENYLISENLRIKETAFHLAEEIPVRAKLFRTGESAFYLSLCFHHIVCDGMSVGIMFNEVVKNYRALEAGEIRTSASTKYDYKDFILWQQDQIETGKFEELKAYWHNKLAGDIPFIDLPVDKPRPKFRSFKGGSASIIFDQKQLQKIREVAQKNNVSTFVLVQAALKLLLHKYTGQNDILIGTPVSGRTNDNFNDTIGLFVNTVVLRDQVEDDETIGSFLHKVKETTFRGIEHQGYPFDKIVEELDLVRNVSRSPLFDVFISYGSGTLNQSDDIGMPDCVRMDNSGADGSIQAMFDLVLNIGEETDYMTLTFIYNSDILLQETADDLLQRLKEVLSRFIQSTEIQVRDLGLIDEQKEQGIIEELQRVSAPVEKNKQLLENFEIHASRNGNAIALKQGDEVVSYKELNSRIQHVASVLVSQYGIKAEDKIGVCMNRSVDMIVSLLAIVKSGAAYVPLDPAYPEQRNIYIMKDVNMKLLIVDEQHSIDNLLGNSNVEKVSFATLEKSDIEKITVTPEIGDLAYVLYTSGSTGTPKGVQIEKSGVSALLKWAYQEFDAEKFDVLYATTSICFDLSVFEIFYTLNAGKTLRILDSGMEIGQWIGEDRNVFLNTVPSVVKNLLFQYTDLKNVVYLNMAGEVIPQFVIDELQRRDDIEVRNLYGPSEDTTYSSSYTLTAKDEIGVPIGKPIDGTAFVLLDQNQNFIPRGMVGELYIAGHGLARGYHNNEAQTTERFVEHPKVKGVRLYKTGDLARQRKDGNFEFLGRNDRQVKIRGHRIELQEIARQILVLTGIEEIVVDVVKNKSTGEILVAFVVTKNLKENEIRSELKKVLPDYMVPDRVIILDEFPLLPNGKINRGAFPEAHAVNDMEIIPARNEKDRQLMLVWSEIFGHSNFGIDHDFFEIGGHSLLAGRMISVVAKQMQEPLKLNEVYAYSTIRRLSNYMSGKREDQLLIPLSKATEEKPNIFFISPVVGVGAIFKPLGIQLKDDFNTYGFNYKGFDNDLAFDNSIEEIAVTAENEINKVDNSDVIYLVGYSMGGLVAYEMARSFEKRGKNVRLIIIDIPPNVEEDDNFSNPYLIGAMQENFIEQFKGFDEQTLNQIAKLYNHNIDLIKKYRSVKGIKNDILLIQASESADIERLKKWKDFTEGQLQIRIQPGDHNSMLSEDLPSLINYIKNWVQN